MPTATEIPASLDVIVDCGAPGCVSGVITHQHERIDPKHLAFHKANHAYTRVEPGLMSKVIGANCDCPRVLDPKVKAQCLACKGTGMRTVHLTTPKPGQRVNVADRELLENIFGEDVPDYPGVVFDVQTPDEHGLELRSGLGVRVSWDLLKNGKQIKSGDVQVWTFDLLELTAV